MQIDRLQHTFHRALSNRISSKEAVDSRFKLPINLDVIFVAAESDFRDVFMKPRT